MTEFRTYIERRRRTEAFPFLAVSEVPGVIQALWGTDFTLHGEGYEFSLEVTRMRDGQMVIETVNRGDFIVRNSAGFCEVVPRREFYGLWELQG